MIYGLLDTKSLFFFAIPDYFVIIIFITLRYLRSDDGKQNVEDLTKAHFTKSKLASVLRHCETDLGGNFLRQFSCQLAK